LIQRITILNNPYETGIFAPTIAHKIHTVNQEADGFKINLEGLLVESGWSDSIRQVDYGSFLYHVGLLDEEDRDFVSRETEVLKTYIAEERYDEAHTVR
jgi:vitellogenic carboxypeptidase-like protein